MRTPLLKHETAPGAFQGGPRDLQDRSRTARLSRYPRSKCYRLPASCPGLSGFAPAGPSFALMDLAIF